MRQVADDVYALGTRGHNYYLIRDGDELTMIDAGCSKEWKQLAQGVASLGLSIDAISGVVVTHAHSDHFGLAKQAVDSGIDVHVHEDEESRATGTCTGRFSASAADLPKFRFSLWRSFLPMLRAGVMHLEFPDDVETFTDGDTLDVPGRPTAIHTPGHTEGHVIFHCPDVGVLFPGDAVATIGLIDGSTGPQMLDDVFHLDPGAARDSLERMRGIEADLLLPGHGQPWRGSPTDAVAKALDQST